MPSNELISICIRKKPKQRSGDIKTLAAQFGIVDSIKDPPQSEFIFVNFSKITDINACLDEFRNFGYSVEESKRNKPQADNNNKAGHFPSSRESVHSSSGIGPPAPTPITMNVSIIFFALFSTFWGFTKIVFDVVFSEKRQLCALPEKYSSSMPTLY